LGRLAAAVDAFESEEKSARSQTASIVIGSTDCVDVRRRRPAAPITGLQERLIAGRTSRSGRAGSAAIV
jgi:hypothetical protein